MNFRQANQINMNNEGYIYLNDNLKINAIKISILKKIALSTHQLQK